MTNFEKIKQMSIEKMAKHLSEKWSYIADDKDDNDSAGKICKYCPAKKFCGKHRKTCEESFFAMLEREADNE